MDLKAANLADGKAWRYRVSLIACFVIASAMLITSLAMAHGQNNALKLPSTLSTTH